MKLKLKERLLTERDYSDREYTITFGVTAFDAAAQTIRVSSTVNTSVGDVLLQAPPITISIFNRNLRLLDRDPQVIDNDYSSTLSLSPGDNLTTAIASLVTKINADTGINDSDYVFTSPVNSTQIRTEYNTIIDKLNLDSGVFYSNYTKQEEDICYETPITAVNDLTNTITVQNVLPFVQGSLTVFEAIKSEWEYVPQTFGDPSQYKHCRENTLMTEQDNFTQMTAAYATDLSPAFESVDFTGQGPGIWGHFQWGCINWGGEGDGGPFRTYLHLEKQRARLFSAKYTHEYARESFDILGISFTVEVDSERAYK